MRLLSIARSAPPTPPFHVEWCNAEVGWFDATLVGEKRFGISAGINDPFPDMLEWVRRCCTDHLPQSFVWNNESIDFLFTYYGQSQYLRVEELTWNTLPEIAWDGLVSLTDLRKAFYLDFMDHIESPAFSELEWFLIPAGEILGRFQEIPQLVESLVALDRTQYEKFWNDFNGLILDVENELYDKSLRSEAFRKNVLILCGDLSSERFVSSMSPSQLHRAEGWETAPPDTRREIVQYSLQELHGHGSARESNYPRIPELEGKADPGS